MSAILALETGHVFKGTSIGSAGICVGELVFNTAMTGYEEIITDPSYAKQIITFTYPHIGNTGINLEDQQSNKIYASGVVIKSLANYVSNWRSKISLQNYLLEQNVIAIADIDTRGLTKIIRQHGSLRACIISKIAGCETDVLQAIAIRQAQEFGGLEGANLTAEVSTTETYNENAENNLHIVLYDFGVKDNIKYCLTKLGCKITVVPANTSAIEVLALKPDGVLLSNGPGDPAACDKIIFNIKILLGAKIPLFGICLGHQLLALALGARTYKMNFGHHGGNHPVQNTLTQKVLITSQNHGFAVTESTLSPELQVTHRSLFDRSLQGFKHKCLPIFGFQGHPEAAPGPHDALEFFDEFITAVREYNAKTN